MQGVDSRYRMVKLISAVKTKLLEIKCCGRKFCMSEIADSHSLYSASIQYDTDK